MAKFKEAEERLIKGKFVCRRCKSVIRSDTRKIIECVVTCRRCASRAFKAKRKR